MPTWMGAALMQGWPGIRGPWAVGGEPPLSPTGAGPRGLRDVAGENDLVRYFSR